MKFKLTIISLFAYALCAVAQTLPHEMIEGSAACEEVRKGIGAPYYYCDCKEESTPFSFPVEAELKDTVWYTATVDDLKQGISAYWFADCSVTMEVYAFCSSKEPTIELTIGKNQMHDIDVATINQKLDEMGKTAQELFGVITPHIRVYPNNGGSGKVYCYPYNQGPESTCENPLLLRPRMTYICDKENNNYKLDYSLLPSTGKAFILWKQEKSKPCEIWLTLDSCNGQEVARTILTDSLHVYRLDSAMLTQTHKAKRTLWLHVQHANDVMGRIYYYINPKYEQITDTIQKSICLGKAITVNMRSYSADTAFIDTLWVKKDTLKTMDIQLTFTEPDLEYDTIYATATEMVRGYRHKPSGAILHSFNDTIVEIKKTNTCTRWMLVTPIEKIPPTPPINTGITDTLYQQAPYKQLQNGQLYIIIDDQRYTILGQKINQYK